MNIIDKNPILQSISNWFRRTFSEPSAVSLFITIVLGILFLEFFGKMFAPILVSVVIAYLLNSVVSLLVRWRIPHTIAVIIVFLAFLGVIIVSIVSLLPLLWRELTTLVVELPHAFVVSQHWVNGFMEHYPRIFSDVQLAHVITFLREQSVHAGQTALKVSLATIPGLVQLVIYFVLVPLLVFFFLKDHIKITRWFKRYTPANNDLFINVWTEVKQKIGAYVRGRVIEIIIVGFVTTATFAILGLEYAVLLGVLVGLSVIIPYIGAVIVTIPVIVIALMQWGLSAHFTYLIIAYVTIIMLDANILVPLLFAEAMDLHPVTIILSVIIFGAFWGFWGIFFAIPLATLVNAILKAWPSSTIEIVEEDEHK